MLGKNCTPNCIRVSSDVYGFDQIGSAAAMHAGYRGSPQFPRNGLENCNPGFLGGVRVRGRGLLIAAVVGVVTVLVGCQPYRERIELTVAQNGKDIFFDFPDVRRARIRFIADLSVWRRPDEGPGSRLDCMMMSRHWTRVWEVHADSRRFKDFSTLSLPVRYGEQIATTAAGTPARTLVPGNYVLSAWVTLEGYPPVEGDKILTAQFSLDDSLDLVRQPPKPLFGWLYHGNDPCAE